MVLEGSVERGVGAVAGQLLNGARACVRDGLTAREQEELVERLEQLEMGLQAQKGERNRGA
jgi:type III secretion system FlhB-like substrate exporter